MIIICVSYADRSHASDVSSNIEQYGQSKWITNCQYVLLIQKFLQ